MFKILSSVLKRKKYFLSAISAAVIIGALSYYLTVLNVYNKSIFIYAEMNGALFTVFSLFFTLIISLLIGCYFALLFFQRNLVKKMRPSGNQATGLSGAVSAVFGSGCPTCGAPLLGFFGLPLGLFSLPFKGIELKLVSIVALLLSIYFIEKSIKRNLVCQIAAERLLSFEY